MNVRQRLLSVKHSIRTIADRHGRFHSEINLVAVSKYASVASIRAAYDAGQRAFGESRIQTFLEKKTQLPDDICWHFIGPIQSNKTAAIAENFAWVHSVDTLKIAERLSAQRPAQYPKLNICLQVNLTKEQQKRGAQPEALAQLIEGVVVLPNLRLRGLMTMTQKNMSVKEQQSVFSSLNSLFQQYKYDDFDSLSMGMTDDYAVAIECGATMVRIGSAIFNETD